MKLAFRSFVAYRKGLLIFMKYKFNDYLISTYDENDNLIIYDTLRQKIWMVEKDKVACIKEVGHQIIETGECRGSIQIVNTLLKCKIIQRTDTDDKEELEALYRNVLFNQNILSVILLPTEKCNFRCTYCYENFQNGKMNDDVISKIEEIINNWLPQYNILHLNWFGGEPLLAMDVIKKTSEKILQICKKMKKPFYSSITTNGYLLDLYTMKELLKLHVMVFQITLDGDRRTHDKQRVLQNGQGTYAVILQNLLNIKNHIKTKTIKIIIRVNVSRDLNENAINKLIKLFEDDKRFIISVQKIFAAENQANDGAPNLSDYIKTLEKCTHHYVDDLDPHETICYAAKQNTLMIRSDGAISKCTVNFQDENNCFGNILSKDVKDITLNSYMYNYSRHKKEICMKCCIYPLCFGRQCPARSYQLCDLLITKYTQTVKSLSSKAEIIGIM